MSGQNTIDKLKSLETAACQARGHVIHRVAQLEMSINIFLAHHFGKDQERSNELLSHIFCTNRMTFDSKAEVFSDIIEKYYPEFLRIKPKCKSELREIGRQRNEFAHLFIDVTDSGIEKKGVVALAKWKNDKVVMKNYTYKMIDDLIDLMYSYIEEISKLTE